FGGGARSGTTGTWFWAIVMSASSASTSWEIQICPPTVGFRPSTAPCSTRPAFASAALSSPVARFFRRNVPAAASNHIRYEPYWVTGGGVNVGGVPED